jgi:hypothetical protein
VLGLHALHIKVSKPVVPHDGVALGRATRGPWLRAVSCEGLGGSSGLCGRRLRPLPDGSNTPIHVGTTSMLVSELVGK